MKVLSSCMRVYGFGYIDDRASLGRGCCLQEAWELTKAAYLDGL